ncbi:SpoIIIAH-like protein [Clostridium acetireducens DSM 10703]|jgi:stage III sporulation protein AH|uniref:SpoIIIAH-like protein n=1 Tax=Clostridium acetireducens DSM 10703 TaxID=1121290 RepID=A0A1E8F2J1_9CLOT|nr:SpoIIIAH-like family protein [Clostridium acetireducens]OFI07594.1 SpoIIIAH-like protein [Clostridium acetireducens DSM 10703]
MNKKQAVIIVSLLALIVCVGVLAAKLNNPLYVNGVENQGKSTISFNNVEKSKEKEQVSKSSEFFSEAILTRDHKNSQTLQNLKSIIDNKNISKEKKDSAAEKYTELAMNINYESRIETDLKAKGFEDVVCSIENDKARIIVKTSEKLTDKQLKDIQNVVMSVAKIKDVEIQTKQ